MTNNQEIIFNAKSTLRGSHSYLSAKTVDLGAYMTIITNAALWPYNMLSGKPSIYNVSLILVSMLALGASHIYQRHSVKNLTGGLSSKPLSLVDML